MSKLLQWSRELWLEAQLAAPPVVQRTVMPRLHQAKEIARLVMHPYLTAFQWQGETPAGALTVSYAGLGNSSSYLKTLLFTAEPTEKAAGQLPVGSIGQQINALDSDLVIIEASQHLTRRLPAQGAVALPFRLQHIVYLQKEWAEVWHNFRSSARKQDVRLVKKFGYEYQLSRNPADVEAFYHTMYVPTTVDRHGELASVSSLENLHRFFQHGFLLQIKRDGRPVSGAICSVHGSLVNLAMTGVLEADGQLMREGAIAAIYYFLLLWAHGAGHQTVNLGFCWPFLKDGIFQFKRKWGATAMIPPREYKHIWLKVQRDTPAVREFLRNNPCVVTNKARALHGLVFTDDPAAVPPETKTEWLQRYETPGLSEVVICSMADLLHKAKVQG